MYGYRLINVTIRECHFLHKKYYFTQKSSQKNLSKFLCENSFLFFSHEFGQENSDIFM